MYYTPGQLRNTIGLSKETFRHWKRVIPAFSRGRGHAPSFSPGDVLASAVLRHLTDAGGFRIGQFSEIAPTIFQVCNSSTWEILQDQCIVIELPKRLCVVVNLPASIPAGDLVIVCTLGPVIRALQNDFFNSRTRTRSPAVKRPTSQEDRSRMGNER